MHLRGNRLRRTAHRRQGIPGQLPGGPSIHQHTRVNVGKVGAPATVSQGAASATVVINKVTYAPSPDGMPPIAVLNVTFTGLTATPYAYSDQQFAYVSGGKREWTPPLLRTTAGSGPRPSFAPERSARASQPAASSSCGGADGRWLHNCCLQERPGFERLHPYDHLDALTSYQSCPLCCFSHGTPWANKLPSTSSRTGAGSWPRIMVHHLSVPPGMMIPILVCSATP